jgi:hypothetical protein
VALVGKNEELKRTSMVIFFLIAAVAIPTYFSGNAAVETLCSGPDGACMPGVSEITIRAHEDAALLAFILMEITGFIAWLGLWQFRVLSRAPRWNVAAVLILSVLAFGFMARAANIGGEIRHTEILSAPPEAAAFEGTAPGLARSLGAGVNAHQWIWPASEALHFIGLSIIFTVVLLMDLRILGMAKRISFPAIYQLLPLGMLGFAANLATGMVFFLATPEQYTQNPIFYWKIVFVVLGAINVLYFMVLDEPWNIGAGDDAPLTARIMAGSAICVWVAVLFFGHMLPFLGNAF